MLLRVNTPSRLTPAYQHQHQHHKYQHRHHKYQQQHHILQHQQHQHHLYHHNHDIMFIIIHNNLINIIINIFNILTDKIMINTRRTSRELMPLPKRKKPEKVENHFFHNHGHCGHHQHHQNHQHHCHHHHQISQNLADIWENASFYQHLMQSSNLRKENCSGLSQPL